MKIISPNHETGSTVQLVFVLPRSPAEDDGETPAMCAPKLFARAEELPMIFGSEKVAKILARHCLKPVVKSASRLTLYWLGDVVAVADRLRRGKISIDVANGTINEVEMPPNMDS